VPSSGRHWDEKWARTLPFRGEAYEGQELFHVPGRKLRQCNDVSAVIRSKAAELSKSSTFG
jgi:hypothetical protein